MFGLTTCKKTPYGDHSPALFNGLGSLSQMLFFAIKLHTWIYIFSQQTSWRVYSSCSFQYGCFLLVVYFARRTLSDGVTKSRWVREIFSSGVESKRLKFLVIKLTDVQSQLATEVGLDGSWSLFTWNLQNFFLLPFFKISGDKTI